MTQIGIRGAVPITILSYLVEFSELHKLTHHRVSPEIVLEIKKLLPKCEIAEEE